MVKPCCVPGCKDKTAPRFIIRSNEKVRQIWIDRIKNEALHISNNPNFFTNHLVCRNHFDNMCFEESGRLRNYSLPTLNLPGYNEPSTKENCFLLPEKEHICVTPEKIKGYFSKLPDKDTTSNPSTLYGEHSPLSVQQPTKVYSSKKKVVGVEERQDIITPSTSGVSMLPTTPSPSKLRIKGEKRACSSRDAGQTPAKKFRGSLLHVGGVTRQKQLSPKAKAFYVRARELQKVAATLRHTHVTTKRKLKFLTDKEQLMNYFKDVNETTLNFFMSQQQTQKHKPRGRRFNLEDKIFALALYKQSGRAYRYLSNIFSLPSRKTVTSLLNKIPFNTGINRRIFDHLKVVVQRMKAIDRNCVIMFDEISLDVGLQYNQRADVVEGLVDYGGSDRVSSFADHALVFLLKGIHRKWKQPMCFTFCEGTTPAVRLVSILKEVVREVRNAGLHIIASISDQGATNRAAINMLLRETDYFFKNSQLENRCQGYLVDGEEIVHLYDFPHLMKGIRNNLIDKNLQFTESGEAKVASWAHLVRLYEIDKRQRPFSQFYKLTDEHVLPNKIKKMRVKNCTQVFSHTVGSAMHTMAKASECCNKESEFYLDPKAVDTAQLFLFFDKLFDSVNGSSLYPYPGKLLRCTVTSKSKHLSFWNSAIPVLRSMRFVSTTDPEKTFCSPSLKFWIFSLQGLKYVVEGLLKKGFKHVPPRCFNQDPVENFFSSVRSHGFRNTNPTCSSFISSVKSLLVNNFVSSHFTGSNCEIDESTGVLDTLKDFVKGHVSLHQSSESPSVPLPVLPSFQGTELRFVNSYASAFIAGYIAKKILAKVPCSVCKKKMTTDKNIPQNILIAGREYQMCKLIRPTSIFCTIFKTVTEVTLNHIPNILTIYGIKKTLIQHVKLSCSTDISTLFCDDHVNNMEIFLATAINVIFFNYIKNVNKILCGSDLRSAQQDPITIMAETKYRKRIKFRNR